MDSSRDTGYLARRAVSVSGLNTPVQDLAQSIEIFTQDFMIDVGAINIADVLSYSASVGVESHDLDGVARQTIRGSSNDFLLRNGFRANRIAADTVNIERTEVVKGASAILYGQTVMGGVVNYVTKEPRFKAGTTVGASYGSFDAARATFDSTGPLVGKKLLYRLVAAWQEGGQWIDWGYDNSKFISPKLAYVPFEGLRFDVSYENFSRQTLFAGSIPFDATTGNRPFVPPPPIDFDIFSPLGFNRARTRRGTARCACNSSATPACA